MIKPLALAAGLIALVPILLGASARAETDHAALAKASLNEVIRPGYAALAVAAEDLEAKLSALCTKPSAEGVDAAETAFASTADAWSKVEIFRFGPVIQGSRYEKLFYWPDPKGLGLRQVQAALAGKDSSVTDMEQLAGKSVALQGLPALEYLLYGDGAESLAKSGGESAFRCSFASAVASNIDRIAKDLVKEWGADSDYAKSFLAPAANDPRYHTPTEVTLELFKSLTSGIELVRDQKIARPLGEASDEAKPKLAAFWRSGLTFANMDGNLEAVRTLFSQGGFAQVVAQESPGVENSILFDLDHAIKVIGGITQPAEQAFRDAATRGKLQALRVSLKSARDTAGDLIARGAGLSFGFNATDGD
jgi:predicted lipoprotein